LNSHLIIQGRAEQVLAGWPDACIDLIITSPPYDLIRTYRGLIQEQGDFPFEALAIQLARVLKPGGALVWVVGDSTDSEGSETLTSANQKIFFRERTGLLIHDTMIYEKTGPACPSKNKYFQTWEYMFVFKKGRNLTTFTPVEDRYNRWYKQKFSKVRTRRDKHGNMNLSEWDEEQGGQYGKRFNIWRYAVGAGNTTNDQFAYQHPAIFPEALAHDHILSWSKPGDLVLDPLCGSGTVLKMAILNGRRCIGIDVKPEYCELSRQRVEVAYNQLGFLRMV